MAKRLGLSLPSLLRSLGRAPFQEEPKEVDVLAEGPPVTMGRSSKSTVQVQPWCRRSPGWGAGDESATTGYRTVGSRHRSEAKLAGAARERSFCDD